MQLVSVVGTLSVIADKGAVAQAEALALLLTDSYAGSNLLSSVALVELLRRHVCLDRCCELLRRHKVGILDVICPKSGRFGARGALTDSSYAVPSNAIAIGATRGLGKQDHVAYAGLVLLGTNVMPSKFCHVVILL